MTKRSGVHISSPNSWRVRPQRLRRSQRRSRISRYELYTMLIYAILMLITILVGMYLGWWSMVREEEEILPPSNTQSEAIYPHFRGHLR